MSDRNKTEQVRYMSSLIRREMDCLCLQKESIQDKMPVKPANFVVKIFVEIQRFFFYNSLLYYFQNSPCFFLTLMYHVKALNLFISLLFILHFPTRENYISTETL
jgi:hypothetical protein